MDLKPCPFCGKENPHILHSQTSGWGIKCVDGCSTSIDGYIDKDKMIETWNSRPGEDALSDRIDRLLEACRSIVANVKVWGKYPVVIQVTEDAFNKCAMAIDKVEEK